MRYYQHAATKTDLFIGCGDAPMWVSTFVNGSRSREQRTPLFCRLFPTGKLALIHTAKWAYSEYLIEINEQEARQLDAALVDRVGSIERGEETPRYSRTKYYGYLWDNPPPKARQAGRPDERQRA